MACPSGVPRMADALRSGFVALPPTFRCEPYKATITVAACARRFSLAKAGGRDAKSFALCVGCPIGPEHLKRSAAGGTEPVAAAPAAPAPGVGHSNVAHVEDPAEIPVPGRDVADENAPPDALPPVHGRCAELPLSPARDG